METNPWWWIWTARQIGPDIGARESRIMNSAPQQRIRFSRVLLGASPYSSSIPLPPYSALAMLTREQGFQASLPPTLIFRPHCNDYILPSSIDALLIAHLSPISHAGLT